LIWKKLSSLRGSKSFCNTIPPEADIGLQRKIGRQGPITEINLPMINRRSYYPRNGVVADNG
jgi:hypothetical protein